MWDQLDAKQSVGKFLRGFVAMGLLCNLLWKMQALKLCVAIWKYLCLSVLIPVQCEG